MATCHIHALHTAVTTFSKQNVALETLAFDTIPTIPLHRNWVNCSIGVQDLKKVDKPRYSKGHSLGVNFHSQAGSLFCFMPGTVFPVFLTTQNRFIQSTSLIDVHLD